MMMTRGFAPEGRLFGAPGGFTLPGVVGSRKVSQDRHRKNDSLGSGSL